jgi:hypothetical protein
MSWRNSPSNSDRWRITCPGHVAVSRRDGRVQPSVAGSHSGRGAERNGTKTPRGKKGTRRRTDGRRRPVGTAATPRWRLWHSLTSAVRTPWSSKKQIVHLTADRRGRADRSPQAPPTPPAAGRPGQGALVGAAGGPRRRCDGRAGGRAGGETWSTYVRSSGESRRPESIARTTKGWMYERSARPWAEVSRSRRGCGRGQPSPGADVGGVSPVPAQMWAG